MPDGGRTARTPGTGPPRVPSPVMVTGPLRTDFIGERRQIHAPSGTCCRSAHDAAVGSTLFGLARPVVSNERRRRACASRSTAREHQRHEVALLQTDAVLARQHSTGGHGDANDLLAGGVHAVHHAGFALVEHQQRVQVAVAGVEHVHHQQLVPLDDLVDLLAAPRASRRRGTTVSCR